MRKDKNSWLSSLIGKVIIKERFGRYVVAEVAADAVSFGKMGKHRRKRLVEKAKKLFESCGVVEFVAEREIAEYIDFCRESSTRIPGNKLFGGFVFAAKKLRAKIKNLIIIDRELKSSTYDNLKIASEYAEEITLLTEKPEYGLYLSDRLMCDYGVCVNVLPEKSTKMSAVINADRRYVRIGDFVVDGVEFESDSRDYDINMSDVAAILGEDNNLEIKNWLSGKNIIKKVDNVN